VGINGAVLALKELLLLLVVVLVLMLWLSLWLELLVMPLLPGSANSWLSAGALLGT
jgi:hypothetical protein